MDHLSTPPAPDQKNALRASPPIAPGLPSIPQAGVLSQPQQATPPQAMPAPSHAQTVAALRHFYAIQQELTTLLKNPDIGKADMRSAIIDGASKLVADRIVPAAMAVQTLSSVPDKPFDQKKWIEQQYMQNMQARNAVLQHHGMANAGQPPQEVPDADNHMQDLQSMMQAHYAGR